MRVSDASFFLSYLKGIRKSRADLDVALRQVADGKRVRHASDDPSGASTALAARARLVRLEGFRRAAELGRADLATLDAALGESFNILSDVRALALAGGSDITSDVNPTRADEVESLRDQLLALANTSQSGRFLLAGTETLTPPFDASGNYAGNGNEVQTPLDNTATVSTTLSGQAVFRDGGDIFTTLSDLATALRNNDTAAVRALIPDLTAQLDHVNGIHAQVGTRLQRIDSFGSRHGDEELRLKQRILEIEDVSLEEVLTNLTAASTSVDALSASAARVLGRSLFDFLV